VARALIVGCGCRGREIGAALRGFGWHVRGTSRSAEGLAAIEEAGIEGAVADPDLAGTVLDLVADVAVVVWLLGSAEGDDAAVEAVHGPRLERILEKLVDSPVRAFLYEATGTVPARHLAAGTEIVRQASARWRIPATVVDSDPGGPDAWAAAVTEAASAGSA
jgi:hypothetical protein